MTFQSKRLLSIAMCCLVCGLNPLALSDTFWCHRCHSQACTISIVFLALQSWNSNFSFRGHSGQSSRHPCGEPLSGTMLAPSSSIKVAIHICALGCIHSAESEQWQTILLGDSRRLAFSFVLHTRISFTPNLLNRTGRLHLCFRCVYTMANKNY